MTCTLCCNGALRPGTVTVTLQRDEATVIVKNVPAQVCDNCGEYYLDQDVTRRVLQHGEEAVRNGAEVEIIRFAA